VSDEEKEEEVSASSSSLLAFFCFCFFALARSGCNRCWCKLLLLHAHPAAEEGTT
jgi:hypothetical protein